MIYMQKKQFLQTLGLHLSAQGYRKISPVCFEKSACESMSYRVLFIFSGRAIIETTPLFGFNFPEVELFLQRKAQENDLPKEQGSKFPTIFKKIDKYIHADRKDIYPIDIGKFNDHKFSELLTLCENVEGLISNTAEMCEYIKHNYDFPIGHHAYRIPVLLRMNDDPLGAKDYELYVDSLDFIQDYKDNLKIMSI